MTVPSPPETYNANDPPAPPLPLAEITFRSATVRPPTVLFGPEMVTPPNKLLRDFVPVTSVPMKLPRTEFFPVELPEIVTPPALPEIRLSYTVQFAAESIV